jgi:hypothetical protein
MHTSAYVMHMSAYLEDASRHPKAVVLRPVEGINLKRTAAAPVAPACAAASVFRTFVLVKQENCAPVGGLSNL